MELSYKGSEFIGQCERGPQRENTISAIRSRAKNLRERAKQQIATACQMESLANALEEITKQALASSKDGNEGYLAYIGVGSDADHALWRLIVEFPWHQQ